MGGLGERQNKMGRPGFLLKSLSKPQSQAGAKLPAMRSQISGLLGSLGEKSRSRPSLHANHGRIQLNALWQRAKEFHTDSPNIRDCGLCPLAFKETAHMSYLPYHSSHHPCSTGCPVYCLSLKMADLWGSLPRANRNQFS